MEALIIGNHVIKLEEITSTNDYASKLLKERKLTEGTVISAEFQSEGKGQRTNQWVSEKGKNLLLSYVINPTDIPSERSFLISMMAALAVRDFLNAIIPLSRAHIKWPNDILLNEKKISGILIENTFQNVKIKNSIVGIGINLNQTKFLLDHVTSVINEVGILKDKDECISTLSGYIQKWYLQLKQGKYATLEKEFNNSLWKRNQIIRGSFKGEAVSVELLHVDQLGFLHFNHGNKSYKSDLDELKLSYE